MKKTPHPITDTLRQKCQETGMSIHAMAQASGVPQSGLHRFLMDGCDLRTGNADKLAAFLGLELTPTKQPPKKGKD